MSLKCDTFKPLDFYFHLKSNFQGCNKYRKSSPEGNITMQVPKWQVTTKRVTTVSARKMLSNISI